MRSPRLGTAEGEAARYSKDHPSQAPSLVYQEGQGVDGCPGNTRQGTRLLKPGGPGVPDSGSK